MKSLEHVVLAVIIPFLLNTAHFAVGAPDPGVDRIWTGTNGASFRGVFSRSLEQGSKVEFLSSNGKRVVVAFGNLIERDQKIIEEFEKRATSGGKGATPAYDPDKFKELPIADRSLIPERKPEDFGGTDDESVVDALWVSLLWWNAFEVMPIPKSGDFDRKAEWLHEELTRYVAQRGSSAATAEEAKEGVEKYFSKRLEDIGACKVATLKEIMMREGEIRETAVRNKSFAITPELVSMLTKGNDIVILRLTMTYDNGSNYVESATFEHFDKDGTFSLHMYGERLKGKAVEVPALTPNRGRPGDKTFELVITDRDSLPKHYVESGAKFYIDESTTGLVLKPFVYKTEGEPAPLPED